MKEFVCFSIDNFRNVGVVAGSEIIELRFRAIPLPECSPLN